MSLLSRLVGGTNLVTHRLGRCAREPCASAGAEQ